MVYQINALLLACVIAISFAVAPAHAKKCETLGFEVNDYGKEGPIRDAKALLDKYIIEWTAENRIKKYKVGKKKVSCYLFLDFYFFDEHTCKAEAPVCF